MGCRELDKVCFLQMCVVQVKPSSELDTLRALYKRCKSGGNPFPQLNVRYTFNVEDESYIEFGTQDCGGPTRRFLGQCWAQFWNDLGVKP